ncbi:MAG: DUF4244 domain-containing protein [Acidimicrobiales bacterium]
MLRLLVHLHALAVATTHHAGRRLTGHLGPDHRVGHPGPPDRPHGRVLGGDAGQTTAEYALVLLGAAAIAALLITWASKSGAIGKLFDAVLSSVLGSVK